MVDRCDRDVQLAEQRRREKVEQQTKIKTDGADGAGGGWGWVSGKEPPGFHRFSLGASGWKGFVTAFLA